jgi:preprotein translocase subunit SecD
MKKPSKPFALLALGIILCTSQMSLFAVNGKSVKEVPSTTTSSFVSTLPSSSSESAKTQGLINGLYLVHREAKSKTELDPLSKSEVVLVNDYEFLAPEERGDTTYIVVSKNTFVPIILASAPVKSNDQSGKPKLEISLGEDQVQPLEKFTREHVMKSVAIVIGGKVVTMHKIRVPIVGGKMQITRCTDHGCEALFTQLQKR